MCINRKAEYWAQMLLGGGRCGGRWWADSSVSFHFLDESKVICAPLDEME